MKLLLCMMAMLIGLRLSAERPAEEAFSIAYNNYSPLRTIIICLR